MKQPATLPTLRRQGAALTVLALAVVLAALAGLCFGLLLTSRPSTPTL